MHSQIQGVFFTAGPYAFEGLSGMEYRAGLISHLRQGKEKNDLENRRLDHLVGPSLPVYASACAGMSP